MKSKVLLNGKWNFIKDENSSKNFENIKLLPFDGTINVPSNWQLEGLNNYNGTLWYIKEFDVNVKFKNALLIFEGVDYFTEVYLNDKLLGFNEGYFQKFYFDISKSLNFNGFNKLTVKVTSPFEDVEKHWPLKKQLIKGIFNHHDCRPGGWDKLRGQDQNTGGIWNNVSIVFFDDFLINDMIVKYKLINDNLVRCFVEFECFSILPNVTKQSLVFELWNTEKKISIIEKEFIIYQGINNLSFSFDIHNPRLWYTWDLGEQPFYILKSNYLVDDQINFSIRFVELDEKSIFKLNGYKLFLRGTNLIPTQFLSDLTKDKIDKIVSLIKEANINIVRVHAHVNRKELYEAFDNAGILVWQDFALQWTYDESNEFVTNAVQQIKSMVKQLYNHPSIAFWCCHNEPGEQVKSLDPFLKDAILSVDTSRIVRLASNYEEHPYDGWYWGNLEHFAATPMGPLVTEFGAQGLPSVQSLKKFLKVNSIDDIDWIEWEYHNFQYEQTFTIAKIKMGNNIDEFVENSQNYQVKLLETAINFYRRKKFNGINGIFQFMFIDSWPSITWSVVDYYHTPKKAYYILKDCYSPLFLSVNLRQDTYLKNSFINFDYWVINDLNQVFKNLKIVVKINGKELMKQDVSIGANEVYFSDYEKNKIYLQNQFDVGNYNLEFCLKFGSKIFAHKHYDIQIIDKQ